MVRFGFENGEPIIVIGDINSSWGHYYRYIVTEVFDGYRDFAPDNWSMSLVTSLAGVTFVDDGSNPVHYANTEGRGLRVGTGTYAGTGEASQVIDLGVPVKAVIVSNGGSFDSARGALAVLGYPAQAPTGSNPIAISVEGTSIIAYGGSSGADDRMNLSGYTYRYIYFY
jgi:hypothetical protein